MPGRKTQGPPSTRQALCTGFAHRARSPWLAGATLLVGASVAACATVPRPPAPPRTVALDEAVALSELPRGLRLITAPESDSNLAHVLVRYDVGSRDDPPGKAGLAHLVEHLSFELGGSPAPSASSDAPAVSATGASPAKTIDEQIRSRALDYNAATSWEYTEYTATVLASDVEALLTAEVNRMQSNCRAELTDEVLEREREVVRNERRTRRRDPTGTLGQELRDRSYGATHPYARPIGGDEQQLAAITRDDVCRFMEQHYGVNRATVVVVGSVDRGQIAHTAAVLFAQARVASPADRAPVEHSNRPGQRADIALAVDQPAVYVAWRAPPLYSRAGLASIVALQLAKETLQRDAPMPVDVFLQGGQRAPLLGLWVGLDHESEVNRTLEHIEDAVDEVTGRISDDDLGAAALGEARDRLFAFESLAARATLYADYAQFESEPGFFAGDLRALTRLDVAEVRRAGEQLFRPSAATTLVVRPDDAGGEYQRGNDSYTGEAIHGDTRFDDATGAEAAVPIDVAASESALERAETVVLSSGLRVVLLRRPEVPTITLRLVFPVGRADEPEERPGLARFAANLLEVPAGAPLDPPGRRDVWDSGGQYSWRVTEDATAFQVRGLAAYGDIFAGYLGALYSFGDYAPAFVRAVAERRRRELDRDSVAHRTDFLAAFGRLVYGAGHPYAFTSELDGLRRGIDARRLAQFRARHYGVDNATLFVVGDFDRTLALGWLEHWFVSSRRTGRTGGAARPPVAAAQQPAAIEIARPGPVTDIALAFAVTRDDPAHHAALLVLRGMLERRAIDIRKRLGVAYTAFAALDDPVGPGALWLSVTADARRAAAATRALQSAVAGVREGANDDPRLLAEFAAARRDVVRELLAESSSGLSATNILQYLSLRELPANYFAVLAEQAGRLSLAQVLATARQTLAAPRERAILHGPPSSTADARARLGY